MFTLPELSGHRKQPPNVCFPFGRLFFSIYYKEPDDAFRYAAETWRDAVKTQEGFSGGVDHFMEREVRTEGEFKAAWQEVNQTAVDGDYQVWVGHLLTHASKQDDNQDGLEFDPGTLTEGEIKALAKLPWSEYGYLVLSSCNSGLIGQRSWTPAGAFATGQGVPTVGQAGYGYFSTQWASYKEKSASDRKISLWAYKRGRNSMLGDGSRMLGIVFK